MISPIRIIMPTKKKGAKNAIYCITHLGKLEGDSTDDKKIKTFWQNHNYMKQLKISLNNSSVN